MEVETDYEHSILKLQTGNYNAFWVICGDGSKYLPNGVNYNLVGQFILCLKTFWKNGGALVFWCDNEPLNYQANLFLETVEFPGGKNVNHIKFEGNHKGEQIIIPGNINIEKKRVFNNKRKFSDGKTERFYLAHNLVNIYEGKTISYVDPKIDIEPFIPFAYDDEGGISIIFYPANNEYENKENFIGDIIIDGGFSKLFNELDSTGTYRYVQNIAAWTTQFTRRYSENENWRETFRVTPFEQIIDYTEIWTKPRQRFTNEFDILFMIDGTGSMSSSITSAKNEIINISNQLKSLFPDLIFQFGCIIYRDPIDSPSDSHSVFQLTNDVEMLKNQIVSETGKGGGDTPELGWSLYSCI